MSVVDLDTATGEYDCKVPLCPRPARANRGRYAYLCDEHAEEARERNGVAIRAGLARRRNGDDASGPLPAAETDGRPDAPPDEPGRENGSQPVELPSLVAIADRIPAAARRLEEALTVRRSAREESRDALRVLNAVLAELREAVQELA